MDYQSLETKEVELRKALEELEAEKAKLKQREHDQALNKAHAAVDALNELGYNYRIVDGDKAPKRSTGTRRRGKTQAVWQIIQDAPDGISTADLMAAMGATDDKAKASISASVNSLKKKQLVTSPSRGFYKAT